MTPDTNEAVALEAERAVLCSLLIHCGPDRPDVAGLEAADFATKTHAGIYRAIVELSELGRAVDAVTVHAHLRASVTQPEPGWEDYLCGLTTEVASSYAATHYAQIVRREARRRRYAAEASSAVQRAALLGADPDEIYTSAASGLAKIAEGGCSADGVTLRALMRQAIPEMEARRAAGGVVGVMSGFRDLDEMIGGFSPGQMVVIAGRPSMGKSSLARAVAVNVAKTGQRVLFFTFEMSAAEIGLAALSGESRVDHQRIRTGQLRESDYHPIVRAVDALHTDALEIVDRAGMAIGEIRSTAKARSAKGKLSMVVVDYLQLASGPGDNREQAIAAVSRGLKALAKELGCPVLALSQLNRGLESRSDKRPMLSDLRESGAIEQDADIVLLIYRDDYYNPGSSCPGVAEIGVGKGRSVGTGVVKLRWTARIAKFDDLALEARR